MKRKNIVTGFASFILVFIAFGYIYNESGSQNKHDVNLAKISPNNNLVAYRYYDYGGGAVGWCQTGLRLHKLQINDWFLYHIRYKKPNGKRFFVSDQCEDEFVDFRWNSDQSIDVQCKESEYDLKPIIAIESVDGIKIRYSSECGVR